MKVYNEAHLNILSTTKDVYINQVNNYLQQLFYNPEQWRSEELRSRVEHNQQLTLVLFYQLSETLTDRQRRRIVDKLDGYIEDMNEIAEDFSKR